MSFFACSALSRFRWLGVAPSHLVSFLSMQNTRGCSAKQKSVCGLLVPSSAREAHFALRAFNVEIAGIKDASRLMGGRARSGDDDSPEGGHSTLAPRLRMQWWKDAVAEIYDNLAGGTDGGSGGSGGGRGGDPILQSLAESRYRNPTLRSLGLAVHKHGLTHQFLRRMMEAREADLEVVQYRRLRDVAHYGEDTVSSLLYLNLECFGVSLVLRKKCDRSGVPRTVQPGGMRKV